MTEKYSTLAQFALLVVFEAIVTALFCWLALPDFAAVAANRVDTGKPSVSYRFSAPGAGDMLLYLPSYGGTLNVSLNNAPVALSLHDEGQLSRSQHLAIATVPAGLLLPANNLLRIDQRDNFRAVPWSPVYFGTAATIMPVAQQHFTYGWLMQQLIPLAGAITVGLSTLLIFFSRRPLKYLFLIMAFVLQTLNEVGDHLVFFGVPLAQLGIPLGMLTNVFIGCSTAVWTQADRIYWRILGWGTLVMTAVFAGAWIAGNGVDGPTAAPISMFYSGWLVFVTINSWVMVLRAKFSSNFSQSATVATIVLAFSGLMAFVLLINSDFSLPVTFFISNWVNVATALGVLLFIFGSLGMEVAGYRSQRRDLRQLTSIVAGHHVEFEQQSLALHRQIEKAAVLEERERFVRDMHDGIGGKLLTLLLKTRQSQHNGAELGSEVQAIIGEMRLITSALDDDGAGLGSALERLRAQVEVQAQAAGIALIWKMPIDVSVPLEARDMLDLARTIQEAVTNAVRHAGAATIEISFAKGGQLDRGLTIVIADDGGGFRLPAKNGGRGLRNMAARIEKIGGTLAFGPGLNGSGSAVTIQLSVPENA